MGLIDKFLDAIKLNDDDYDDDDYLDSDFDEEDDGNSKVKRRFFKRMDEEEDDEDDFEPRTERENKAEAKPAAYSEPKAKPQSAQPREAAPRKEAPREKERRPERRPVRPAPAKKRGGTPMEVSVIRPTSMEEARDIADTLLDECTVVLNLEGLDVDVAQRIIDFTCGACYSLNGSIQMISSYIFILTPANVDISGDYQSILSDAFDVPAMKSQY
ncbi:MAG: cell division protein SepF [Lachnospiraceae bacterium]|nr:cell division protein SepF [Lachnospiraceae bacterium]